MTDTQWLNSLRVGDKAVVDAPRQMGEPRIVTVERVTGTQIVAGGLRFRNRDGKMLGAESSYLRKSTPELLEKVERAYLVGRIVRINKVWLENSRSTDQLRRIVEILDEPKESEERA